MNPCTLHKLTDHVYWYSPDSRTDRPALGAVVGARAVLMVDVGASPAHTGGFLDALSRAGVARPRYAVLTHWHWDHSFGGEALGIPIMAHRETARHLKIQAGYEWSDSALDQRVADGLEIEFCQQHIKLEIPDLSQLKIVLPDIIFDDHLTLDLGDLTAEVVHAGGDHAADSVVVYVPEDRVLFLSDCLYPNLYSPVRHYTHAKLVALLDKVEAFAADYYVLGHHENVLSKAEMQDYLQELRVLDALAQRHGNNRDLILSDFQLSTGRELNADVLESADEILAGLG